jgi:autotransporter strand-loop-strand O-heptosyltransferase
MKYWNHPDGKSVQGESPYWNELCKMLRKSGITPVCLELDEEYGVPPYYNKLPNKSLNKVGMPLEEVVNYIEHSEFYIGLSSGMTWAAHALGKPVAMIANFTEDWNEMDLEEDDYIRITNKDVCHGCWGNTNIDIGDWDGCPKHQNTNRQFECHTSITPEQVFGRIKKWIEK